MKKPWSISTTVRNPERLRNFLIVLKKLEGQVWNKVTQKKFQVMLIQYKYYGYGKPQFYNNLSEKHKILMSHPEKITYKEAEEILDSKNYEGGGDMRGRNSFAPLNKMGFTFLSDHNKIEISDLGNYFLTEEYDLGEVFFRSFVKYQLPNPVSKDFRSVDGFNIKPYVGILHLIKKVNGLWQQLGNKPVGINKEEFSIFATSLIDYTQIDKYANKIIEFRNKLKECTDENEKKEFKKNYKQKSAADFLGTDNSFKISRFIDNSEEYADNAIRYFRLTKYVYIRGNGFYIDLEPRRIIEIEKLLETDNAAPMEFSQASEYLKYLSDIKQPVLPWESDHELRKIIDKTKVDINNMQESLNLKGLSYTPLSEKNILSMKIEELKNYLNELRLYRKSLQEKELQFNAQDIENIRKCIDELKNIFQSKEKRSIELERLATFALSALNDALCIKPNYPVGDDNQPTFTAPGDKPDIECYYKLFNGVCEVTLLTNRSQWYNEGQPVMRHTRDFENKNPDKDAYCLFVAPSLHRDTINTFWQSVKYEYEGSAQKIIPLTLKQLIAILEILVEIKEKDKDFSHSSLLNLYNNILEITKSVSSSNDWIQQVPTIIENWKKETVKS